MHQSSRVIFPGLAYDSEGSMAYVVRYEVVKRCLCVLRFLFFVFLLTLHFLKSEVDKHAFLRTEDLGSERFSKIGNNSRRYPPTPDIWDRKFLFYSRFFASTRTRRKGFFCGCMGSRVPFLGTAPLYIDSRLTIYTIPANVFET